MVGELHRTGMEPLICTWEVTLLSSCNNDWFRVGCARRSRRKRAAATVEVQQFRVVQKGNARGRQGRT